jgi:hypothetical protein
MPSSRRRVSNGIVGIPRLAENQRISDEVRIETVDDTLFGVGRPRRDMAEPLPGRYVYHDDADPSSANFLAKPDSISSDPGGRVNAVLHVFDDAGRTIGTVTVWADDLPDDLRTVYRVTPNEDGEFVEMECGERVSNTTGYNFVEYFDTTGCRKSPRDYSRQYKAYRAAREETRAGGDEWE